MLTQVLKVAALGLLFATIAQLAFVIARQPTRSIRELGVRGLRRRSALARHDLWANSEPLIRWLGARAAPLVPKQHRERFDSWLTAAGDPLGLEPEEVMVITLLCATVGFVLALIYTWLGGSNPIRIVFITIGCGAAPLVKLDGEHKARALRIKRGLPGMVDLLCLSLSAGVDFPGALRNIVTKTDRPGDALMEELQLVLSEIQLGKTRREALELFCARNPNDAVKEFVGFVLQSEEEGNPLADILQIQATVSRQRRSVRAEQLAANASVKIIAPIGMALLSIMILIGGPLTLNLLEGLNNSNA